MKARRNRKFIDEWMKELSHLLLSSFLGVLILLIFMYQIDKPIVKQPSVSSFCNATLPFIQNFTLSFTIEPAYFHSYGNVYAKLYSPCLRYQKNFTLKFWLSLDNRKWIEVPIGYNKEVNYSLIGEIPLTTHKEIIIYGRCYAPIREINLIPSISSCKSKQDFLNSFKGSIKIVPQAAPRDQMLRIIILFSLISVIYSVTSFWFIKYTRLTISTLLIFIVLPAILALIFYSRISIENRLIALFLSNFLHGSINHLRDNIIGYYLFLLPLFLLVNNLKVEKYFWLLVALNLTLVPIILSLLPFSGIGFSGIDSAFLGNLGFFLALFMKERLNIKFWTSWCLILFLGFVVPVINYFNFSLTDFLLLITVFVLLFYFGYRFSQEVNPYRFRLIIKNKYLFTLLLICLIIYCIGTAPLYPKSIKVNGHLTGIHVHYTGFVIGMISPLISRNLYSNRKEELFG